MPFNLGTSSRRPQLRPFLLGFFFLRAAITVQGPDATEREPIGFKGEVTKLGRANNEADSGRTKEPRSRAFF